MKTTILPAEESWVVYHPGTWCFCWFHMLRKMLQTCAFM